MATFSFEAEDFTLLTPEAARDLAPSVGLESSVPFVQYQPDKDGTLIEIPFGDSSSGDRAIATTTFPTDLDNTDPDNAGILPGLYTATVRYIDEKNAESRATLIVGENDPQSWTFNRNTTTNRRAKTENFGNNPFVIRQGDTITLIGQRDDNGPDEDGPDGDELARIDGIDFTEVVSGELNFEVASNTVSESATDNNTDDNTVEVTITRSRADVGTTRANLILGGTATNGNEGDYTLSATEVILEEGLSEKTITITLTDDEVEEGNETLTLTLAAIANESVIGEQDTFTLTIEDDDTSEDDDESSVIEPPTNEIPINEPPINDTPILESNLTPGTSDETSTPIPSPTSDSPDETHETPTPTSSPTQVPIDEPPVPTSNPEPDSTSAPNSTDDSSVQTPSPTAELTGNTDDPPTIVAGETTEEPVETDGDAIAGPTQRADILNGTDEVDVINALRGNDVVVTGQGDDQVWGKRGRDFIDVGNSNDRVMGGRHRDVINAGDGDDFVNGGRGGDEIRGGAGNDTLLGGRGRDSLFGDAGDDTLNGGRARDQLNGGGGDDILDGGAGSDTLTGGTGSDIFVLSLRIGRDTITDFDPNDDRLQLKNGLTFADLDIQALGADTTISTSTGQPLAHIENVDASLITKPVFV
ncbi:MAG: Calx-beta domain-containing protein [Leptolyngbyaceae cyanobacterium]